MDLWISSKTFSPSTVTNLVANELDLRNGDTVVDVGCGSGVLAIIAAKLGARSVFGVDISPDAVKVGTHNASLNDVADQVTFFQGNLFEPLPDDLRADVIIGDVSGIPDTLAYNSGWFPSGKGGGARGSELPVRMLRDAISLLKEAGRILLPTGTLQDEESILDVANSLYRKVRLLTERRIPLPATIAESHVLADLIYQGVIKVSKKGSRTFWEARVWELSSPL